MNAWFWLYRSRDGRNRHFSDWCVITEKLNKASIHLHGFFPGGLLFNDKSAESTCNAAAVSEASFICAKII
jgi:hypothetical protein